MAEKSLKNKTLSPAQKAAKTRIDNYLNAGAKEKARIDEIRHLAAIKSQTKNSSFPKFRRKFFLAIILTI